MFFKTLQNQSVILEQYRILHCILGVRYLRYKMKQENSPICNKCYQFDQTLLHLFTQCLFYIDLWQDLQCWINSKISFEFNVSPQMIILGYLNTDNFSIPINTILMITKQYILMSL